MEKCEEHSRRGENDLKKNPTQVSLQKLYVRQQQPLNLHPKGQLNEVVG